MNFIKKLRSFSIFLLLLVSLILLAACQNSADNKLSMPARYGNGGRALAVNFAQTFPERYAGSEQENSAGDWLIKRLENLGYNPQVDDFTFTDNSGKQLASRNISVKIKGTGFEYTGSNFAVKTTLNSVNERFILIGTHYDTPIKDKQAVDTVSATGDGIHNNAAGVASLLTIAKEMQRDRPAYNVQLVFFGAGTQHFAGAEAFLEQMSVSDLEQFEAMYNIDKIYAGDKVYAHAGQNSVIEGLKKSYEKRKKLYEMTDVYYNYMLLTNNDFSLYTNQNIFTVEATDFTEPILFREWTTHLGDHTPFDQVGIPIVFLESFEYDVESYDELGQESTDPTFNVVGGIIDCSNLDSSAFLNDYYQIAEEEKQENVFGDTKTTETEQEDNDSDDPDKMDVQSLEELRNNRQIDRLERRINNVAFLIIKSAQRGDNDFVPKK
ncbi:MAG TPA: M28 family peptidase [Clostridiaceae bacterium]|nr:M28 family peptidase [Clostridiaceae bacterium]